MVTTILLLFLAGAAGSLAKDILEDGKLRLPKVADGDLSLGFLGGLVTGGIAGYFIDGSFLTAFMGGYAGTGVLQALLAKKNSDSVSVTGITEALIRKIATEESVDPDLAVRVAKCESSLNWKATNTNTDSSCDWGLYQINNKWHPEVTEAEAFDPIFSTKFFCKAFKAGNLSWWNATKKCWEK